MEFEQKIAEASLSQSKEQTQDMGMYLYAIFNNTGDPIFVKDEDFKFVLVNDACCRFFGMSRDQILGSTLAENFPPEEMDVFFLSIKRCWRKEKRFYLKKLSPLLKWAVGE